MSPRVSSKNPFADDKRRLIGSFCRSQHRTLGEIAARLKRKAGAGSVSGLVARMVDDELLTRTSIRRGRSRFGYLLNPAQLAALTEAERVAPAAPRTGPPELRSGLRLLLIDGPEMSRLAAELQRLSMDRHAEWAARLDGPGGRILLGVADDGRRCDEVESAIERVQGTAVQARIDSLFDPEDFASWMKRTS